MNEFDMSFSPGPESVQVPVPREPIQLPPYLRGESQSRLLHPDLVLLPEEGILIARDGHIFELTSNQSMVMEVMMNHTNQFMTLSYIFQSIRGRKPRMDAVGNQEMNPFRNAVPKLQLLLADVEVSITDYPDGMIEDKRIITKRLYRLVEPKSGETPQVGELPDLMPTRTTTRLPRRRSSR